MSIALFLQFKILKFQYFIFLKNPVERKRIAEAGRERALKEYTYKHRLSVILKSVGLRIDDS